MLERLRAKADRWPWLAVALDVQKRFGELNGSYLASAVTLAAFLSMFPLVLVGIAVVGFFSNNEPTFAQDAIRELGLTGDAAEALTTAVDTARDSRQFASVLGLAGLLWTGLGLVAALQYALNAVWQVTGRGLKDKAVGLAWLVGAALIFVASFGLTAAVNFLPPFLAPLGIAAALAVDFGLFLWTMKVLPHRDVGFRALVPGAIFGAVGLTVLKALGSFYVPRLVASSSGLYGSIGTVFAVLAWLFFFGRLIVYASTLNVVLWERHHGTVVVDLEVPKIPGRMALEATRAGDVTDEPAEPVSQS
jgi:membrane protein